MDDTPIEFYSDPRKKSLDHLNAECFALEQLAKQCGHRDIQNALYRVRATEIRDAEVSLRGQVRREVEAASGVLASEQAQPQTASAWMHDEDSSRVISAAQKSQAMRDGGASASSVASYSIPLGRLDAHGVPAVAAPKWEPSEAQISAALEAANFFNTAESRKDMRRALLAAAGIVPPGQEWKWPEGIPGVPVIVSEQEKKA